MKNFYVHGYDPKENIRLQDQAATLAELLHFDTIYPANHKVLEAGCGVGAQTLTLAQKSPAAQIFSIDISQESVLEAKQRVESLGIRMFNFNRRTYLIFPLRNTISIIYLSALSWSICQTQTMLYSP